MTPTGDPASDPVDVIAAALAQLRGRRGPHHHHGGSGGLGGPGGLGAPGGPGGAATGDPSILRGRLGPHGHGATRGGHGRFADPARLRLLAALAEASVSMSVSEVAERIGVDQPRASRLVAQSVELGLVRREPDPDDARRTRVVLTDQGRAIVKRFRGDRREVVATALAAFTDEERADLARLLAKFAAAWPR